METIVIGKVVNVKGLKGEVKVYPYTETPQRFDELAYLYVGETRYEIERVGYHKNMPVVKLASVDTVEQAQRLRNQDVSIDKSQVRPLDEGEYLIIDMIGMTVEDEHGPIGILKDVLTHTAQQIYVVDTPDGERLIPAVPAFIRNVDMENRTIHVALIEGL